MRRWTRNRMAGTQLDPLKIIWLQRLFVCIFPAYWDRKRWAFSNFVFRTVELRFVYNNHAIQSSLLFHLIFSQQEIFSSRLSSFCSLTSDLHLACVCVGIMLQATARLEAFFSQIFTRESRYHYLGEICCYALYCYHLLKAFRKSNCSVCIMSVRLMHLIVSWLEGFCIRNTLRLMNSIVISRVICVFISRNSAMISRYSS